MDESLAVRPYLRSSASDIWRMRSRIRSNVIRFDLERIFVIKTLFLQMQRLAAQGK